MKNENENDSNARIEGLIVETKKRLNRSVEDDVQTELAELLGLLHDLRRSKYTHLIGIAEIAFLALLSEQPNLKLAQQTRKDLSNRVLPSASVLASIIQGGTPSTLVIFGLGALLYFALPVLWIMGPDVLNTETIVGVETEYLLLVGVAGAIGSIVSIMVRIQDFSGLHDVDPMVLFVTGFFKPVVGASFALFVFAAFRAGLIPFTVEEGAERYFFMALSFVTGFSERFAKDIVKTTELKIGGPSP